jgi:P4 family phage/plasmid primase-like protien
MEMWAFVNQYKTTDSKLANLTSISGGKWNIPPDKVKQLYKHIRKAHKQREVLPPFAEKMGESHPLVFDFDMKHNELYTEHQYGLSLMKHLCELLWIHICEVIDIEPADESKYGEAYVMIKPTPYPCSKGTYQSKDGLHIAFPKICLKRAVYKILCKNIQAQAEQLFELFTKHCKQAPSNLDNTLFDGNFTRWMPYLCHKAGEKPYQLVEVFSMCSGNAERKNPELVTSVMTLYTPEVLMMELSMIRNGIQENVSYTETVMHQIQPKQTMETTTSSDDIYKDFYVDNEKVINPYKIVEEDRLKYVIGLLTCLSKKRAETYDTWLSVGFCLHNINPNLLNEWKQFSRLANNYDPDSCNKQWVVNGKSNYDGHKYGIGSLVKWAKEDNEDMFDAVKRASVEFYVHESVKNGTDADFLIATVIHQYFENEFISMNVKDEWYYFNGVRWERTLEGTKLRMSIHKKIWKIYHEYEQTKYKVLLDAAINNADSDDEKADLREGKTKEGRWLKNIASIKMKLLKDSYVTTLMNSLRNLFYKKEIAKQFDDNSDLVGLENCVIDLKEKVFREGRPEDYVTTTTEYGFDVGDNPLPIKITNIQGVMEKVIPNYTILKRHLSCFLDQVIPDKQVQQYTVRFLAKCLSGENRDEGFYIWTGSGGNGKSKLIELMQGVLGGYAGVLPVSLITSKRSASNGATPEMERTKGLRFVVMQEPEANEQINIGLMKELTGNDKITARGLFKDPIEFVPQFKLLLMCNDLPNIPSNDDGTWRRLEVVNFVSRFIDEDNKLDSAKHVYKRDKQLRAKLQAWPIVFLGMLLEEWIKYDKDGIVVPAQVNSKTKSYRDANDTIGRWISESCEEAPNKVVNGVEVAPTSFGDLYEDFEEWCKESGSKSQKSKMKEDLLKWQEKSQYGLSIGKSVKDGCSNGTRRNPKFNLVVLDEVE